MAVTVTAAGLGTTPGAVYRPEPETVPTVALPPVTPFTCQVTAVLLVFCTVAVNCCVPPTATVADVGEIMTLTATEVCVVVTPAQPKSSNALNPTATSQTQAGGRPIAFSSQPHLEVNRNLVTPIGLVPHLLVLYENVLRTQWKHN
jgi:hypothetical protein